MATLPADTWIRLFVWLLIGFVIYFGYGRKHSVLQQERSQRRVSLFRRKDISALQAEVGSDQSLKRALGPVNLVALGIGAIIGAGIFVLTGQAAANYAGPGHRLLVHPGGHRLRLRRPVLRRVRVDDPDRRLGLHLRLRHAGRVRRLDHRLGPDPRVPLRGLDRRGRLVGLRGLVPQGPRHQHPAAVHLRAVHPHGAARRRAQRVAAVHRGLVEHRRGAQRAGDVHRRADHDPAGHRHHGVGQRSTT